MASAGGGEHDRARYSRYANATFRMDRRLNSPVEQGPEAIQKRALAEGPLCQTLISSLLPKYASGRLPLSRSRFRSGVYAPPTDGLRLSLSTIHLCQQAAGRNPTPAPASTNRMCSPRVSNIDETGRTRSPSRHVRARFCCPTSVQSGVRRNADVTYEHAWGAIVAHRDRARMLPAERQPRELPRRRIA